MSRHGLYGQERELLEELAVKELQLRKEISALSARLRIAHSRQQERRAARAHKQQALARHSDSELLEHLASRQPPRSSPRKKPEPSSDGDDDEDYYRTDLDEVGLSESDAKQTLEVLDLMSGLGMDVPERLIAKLRCDQLSRSSL